MRKERITASWPAMPRRPTRQVPFRRATKRNGADCKRHIFFEVCDTDQIKGKPLVNEPSKDGSIDWPAKMRRTGIVVIRDVAIPSPIALLAFMTT